METVTLDTKIGELLKACPEAAKVLKTFNLDCIGCGGAANETIAAGAMAHGLDPDKVVAALNTALKKS